MQIRNSVIGIPPVHKVTQDGATLTVYHANKGQGLPRHEHVYSHLTMVHSGSCLITKENKSLTMNKNTQPVNLAANEWHEIEALEDGTVFVNVFSEGKY
jgi:quercetin dioxygenase-like cupin family protein